MAAHVSPRRGTLCSATAEPPCASSSRGDRRAPDGRASGGLHRRPSRPRPLSRGRRSLGDLLSPGAACDSPCLRSSARPAGEAPDCRNHRPSLRHPVGASLRHRSLCSRSNHPALGRSDSRSSRNDCFSRNRRDNLVGFARGECVRSRRCRCPDLDHPRGAPGTRSSGPKPT